MIAISRDAFIIYKQYIIVNMKPPGEHTKEKHSIRGALTVLVAFSAPILMPSYPSQPLDSII